MKNIKSRFGASVLRFCICWFLLTSCSKQDFIHPVPLELASRIAHKSENLVVITLDGVRWQEVFQGADSLLLHNPLDVRQDTAWLDNAFWDADIPKRRSKLSPFFWNEVASKGCLYGNRKLNSYVNVTNHFKISFPGYGEMFSGYADPEITSNDYGPNPDYNIFEFLLQQPGFRKTDIAIFSEWGAFANILNEDRSHLNLFAGAKDGEPVDKIMKDSSTSRTKAEVNDLGLYKAGSQPDTYDRSVYIASKSYLVKYHPRVLYIAFGAADTYGHWRQYDAYLKNIYNVNRMIDDLWQYCQSDSSYKDKTTFFITTDHGRGIGSFWTDHGSRVDHSDEIWFAVIGPDTREQGEMKGRSQLYLKQIAGSLTAFLGYELKGVRIFGDRISQLMDNE